MTSHHLPDPAAFLHSLTVRDVAGTLELAARAAGLVTGGEIILLHGPLGAGKTCFCQGLCRALGVGGDEVVSPTFTLVNTHPGRPTVHHLDFYRVEPGQDLEDIGVPAILDEVWDGQAVALVEWPQPLLTELGAAPRIELLVTPGARPDERTWRLGGSPPAAWLDLFAGGQAC